MKGSVVKPTEVMGERESIEAFIEGAKKSSSAARELAVETNNPEWITIASTLDAMREGGKKLSEMRSMSRFETLMAAQMKTAPYKPH